jgi:hypothetical protein
MVTPDSANPVSTDYYYGNANEGWNGGVWDELVAPTPAPKDHLHNFAPIVIADGTTSLTFRLCGNAYFYGYLTDTSAELYANILIADCDLFTNGGQGTDVDYIQLFGDSESGHSVSISATGMVCFDFEKQYSISSSCQYQAAVALVVVSDDTNSSKLDFSYQLRVIQ